MKENLFSNQSVIISETDTLKSIAFIYFFVQKVNIVFWHRTFTGFNCCYKSLRNLSFPHISVNWHGVQAILSFLRYILFESLPVRGSFEVQFGDHFPSGDHLRAGIICGPVQPFRRYLRSIKCCQGQTLIL